jgi:hypothetical protein
VTTSLPKSASVAALAVLLMGAVAIAKPVTVVPGQPPVTVDLPAGWTSSAIKRGIQAKTSDAEVFVWFESFRPAELKELLAEHESDFKRRGVTVTGEANIEEKDFPTYFLKITDVPATYEGKPTLLRYVAVSPKDPNKRQLLVSVWASPKGGTRYATDLNAIFDSFRMSVEAL